MQPIYAKDRREWRAWLENNHGKLTEAWLLYYKKGTGKPRVPYEEAVEEALCFGWIDGTTKRIDEVCYAQRFTPRTAQSTWNQANIQRAERLIAEGKMAPAGLKAYQSGKHRATPVLPTEMPRNLERAFRKQAAAWRNYQSFPPYYRRMTAGWVASAKKEETQLKRLEKLIEFSARNERIKFM
jgi:uncharacterized protein YdeI (YjbR/CyaY-like superfamily)